MAKRGRKGKGWPREPARHGLASKGIRTRHLRDQLRRLRRAEKILKRDVKKARRERAYASHPTRVRATRQAVDVFEKDLKRVAEERRRIEAVIRADSK